MSRVRVEWSLSHKMKKNRALLFRLTKKPFKSCTAPITTHNPSAWSSGTFLFPVVRRNINYQKSHSRSIVICYMPTYSNLCGTVPYQYRSIFFFCLWSRVRYLVGTSRYSEYLQVPTKYLPSTNHVLTRYRTNTFSGFSIPSFEQTNGKSLRKTVYSSS